MHHRHPWGWWVLMGVDSIVRVCVCTSMFIKHAVCVLLCEWLLRWHDACELECTARRCKET